MRKASPVGVCMLLLAGIAACGDQHGPTAQASPAAGIQTASTADLPLKRGYYVASDTPCGNASNATVLLLRREGIGGARYFCEFRGIERTGPDTYRVTQACGEFQSDTPPETVVDTYTLSGDARFALRSQHGREYGARYCTRSSMPPEWRANDIGDVTD